MELHALSSVLQMMKLWLEALKQPVIMETSQDLIVDVKNAAQKNIDILMESDRGRIFK